MHNPYMGFEQNTAFGDVDPMRVAQDGGTAG